MVWAGEGDTRVIYFSGVFSHAAGGQRVGIGYPPLCRQHLCVWSMPGPVPGEGSLRIESFSPQGGHEDSSSVIPLEVERRRPRVETPHPGENLSKTYIESYLYSSSDFRITLGVLLMRLGSIPPKNERKSKPKPPCRWSYHTHVPPIGHVPPSLAST